MKVEVVTRKLVKPSVPTPSHLTTYKLSLFDQLAPPIYVTIILYYTTDDNESPGRNPEDRAKFEQSLSEVLTKFYPLAGRLVKDNLLIVCNDQGVDFLEADVNVRLDEFLGSEPQVKLLDQFVPWDLGAADSISSPMMAIQINRFDCGGLVVGLRVSHKIADASTMFTFINSWASLSKLGTWDEAISPKFGSGSIFPTINMPGSRSQTTPTEEAKIVTRRYVFNEATTLALKERAKGHRSRVVVITTLLWKALMGMAQAKHGQWRPSLLGLPINLRDRTGMALPGNCFGNLSSPFTTKITPNAENVQFEELVVQMGDALRDCLTTMSQLKEANEISSMVMNLMREGSKRAVGDEPLDVCRLTSWCGFRAYEADFGWGKPTWVSIVSHPYEAVTLLDTKNGNGIEAWVTLKEEDIIQLEKDVDILQFTS